MNDSRNDSIKKDHLVAIIVLIAFTAGEVQGASCSDTADSSERLACYDRLAGCVTTHDPDARLACYDAVQAPSWAEPPSAGEETAAPSEPVTPPARADEAFPVPGKTRREDEPKHLLASIVEVDEDPRGLRYLTLDNGQIWRELSRSRVRFQPGARVEIRSGILGSVNLRIAGSSGYVKVRRVE